MEKKKVLSEKPKIQEKLSYKEVRELSLLPEEIEGLNQKIMQLEETMTDTTLYQRDPKKFEKITHSLQTLRHDLHHKEERWLELLEKEEALGKK
jgi:ATP-binding cassette subfamily F protein uup